MRCEKVLFQWPMRNELFLIVINHSTLVKGAVNAARVCKLRTGVKKMSRMRKTAPGSEFGQVTRILYINSIQILFLCQKSIVWNNTLIRKFL
jgi:hypothetical protein